ncbi:hypothetical protein KIW84_030618 [Lathyrus oleraceus]|uniref:TF-B3 domain-containing protein n=1 Tax=Pisum sativum TaxID=3888 RepID=A0A9D4XTL9_PEA|nr:hypothetical protein KIW84_030618 [Pisum sativum]
MSTGKKVSSFEMLKGSSISQIENESAWRRRRLNEGKQVDFGEEEGKVKNVDGKIGRITTYAAPSHISNSCGSVIFDENITGDESSDEDLSNQPRFVVWKKEIKDEKKIPQSVIKKCFLTGLRSTELVGVDTMETYDCKVHTSERKYYVEMFIGRGWYEYAKKKGLKKGDIVGFSIHHPPARRIVVSVLNL